MTPDFALHFTVDEITLDQRVAGFWVTLGKASFTSGQFAGEITALRSRGMSTAKTAGIDFATKLVLPDEQIKFLTLRDRSANKSKVSLALEGATPYALEDLQFDWISGGGTTRIAAVAKETLQEAQSFAEQYGFAPIAFVALPENGWDGSEAFFGAVSGSQAERDETPYIRGTVDDVAAAEAAKAAQKAAEEVETTEFLASAEPVPEEPAGAVTLPSAPKRNTSAFQSIRRPDDVGNADLSAGVSREKFTAPTAARITPKLVMPQADEKAIGRAPPAPPVSVDHAADAKAAAATLRPVDVPEQPPEAETEPARDGGFAGFQSRRAQAAGAAELAAQQNADQAGAIGGKPRYLGLALTVALILALLAVAAFAATREDGLARFFDSSIPEAPEIPPTALAAPEISAPPLEVPSIAPKPLARAAVDPPQEILPATIAEEGIEAEVPASPIEPAAITYNQNELERIYAATGIWSFEPSSPRVPLPTELDTFYITSIDAPLRTGDAVALETAASFEVDDRPAAQPVPPAPQTTFRYDDRGLLIATPKGAISPLGYTVFAGRPPIEPPFRLPEETEPEEESRELLAAFRPRPRPIGLAERNERLALDGFTRSELAAFRPRIRPLTTKAPEEVEEPDAPPSELAITASRRPATRPQNFDRIVASARASQPTTVAVAAPVAQRVTAPSGPTRATVARAATTKNAINLRRVSLIGVYGTQSNRSALVRLANGRFVKVQVGGQLDGGRVAAISESALRYVKRGRNITLEIPTG
ncbi:MAG: hypothetical protein AAGF13_07865 [Pseudomonadota bacterium]